MKIWNISVLASLFVIAFAGVSPGQTAAGDTSDRKEKMLTKKLRLEESRVPLPKEGLVPDKETAVKIAEVVLFRLYGEKDIVYQKPYNVKEEDYIWWIYGSLPEGSVGTVFNIAVSKHTAAILHLSR